MKTGTGGLKDGAGVVLIISTSESEGALLIEQYRAVNQNLARFDVLANAGEADIASIVYPAGTRWCVAGDTPLWFGEGMRARFNRIFGPQLHTSQAFATWTDEYAIDPKLLRTPVA